MKPNNPRLIPTMSVCLPFTCVAQVVHDNNAYISEHEATIVAFAETPDQAAASKSAAKEPGEIIGERRGGRAIEEVVVTAQKREERLEDVPISISIVGGERLDKSSFQGVREALNTVPGIAISTDQNQTPAVTIRGVAPVGGRFGGGGVVGYYIDSVPFALAQSAIVPDSNVYDLERVEVLRGPQGTLYGASALNGVVRVLTHDAELDAFDLKARSTVSSLTSGSWEYGGDMAINVPIATGKIAARAVVGYESGGGWIDRPNDRDADDSENKNLRLRIKAKPTESFTVGMSAWLSRLSRDAPPIGDRAGHNPNASREPNEDNFDAYGITAHYQFSSFEITSMTSYLEYTARSDTDFSYAGLPVLNRTTIEADGFSEEILVTSNEAGPWRWSIGGIYRDARERTTAGFPFISVTPNRDDTNSSRSYAIYAEATRELIKDRLEITGGARYFEDRVEFKDEQFGNRSLDTFDKITPRAVLTWHINDDVTAYSSYAEGFRSGVNQSAPVARLGVPATGPDTLKNYELGAKGNVLDRAITFDAAIYFMDWRDLMQVLIVNVPTSSGVIPTGALINSGSASGVGVDLGLAVRARDNLNLAGNASWNDLSFDADVISGTTVLARKGDRLSNSREWTWGLSAEYSFPLARNSGLEAQLAASYNHVSEQLVHSMVGTYIAQPISLGRASLSIRQPGSGRWGVTLFVDNIADERNTVFVPVLDGAPPYGNPSYHTRPQPRTIGLQVDYQL